MTWFHVGQGRHDTTLDENLCPTRFGRGRPHGATAPASRQTPAINHSEPAGTGSVISSAPALSILHIQSYPRKRRNGAPRPTTCLPTDKEAICEVDIPSVPMQRFTLQGCQASSHGFLFPRTFRERQFAISGISNFPWQAYPHAPIPSCCFSARQAIINQHCQFLDKATQGSQYCGIDATLNFLATN